MARINSNIPSLIARSNLDRANEDLEIRLQRLSTGLRINRGADDPAGLIISERLRSEINGLDQAVKNSERASSVIATSESALSEVSQLLNSIKALVVEGANTGAISDEERKANQLQIDSAIDSITRISNSTSFGGLNLLNGELEYTLSGVTTSEIANARVFAANFAGQPNIQVDTEVINSAQTGNVFLRGDYSATPAANGTLLSSVTFELRGSNGVQELSFLSGTALSDVVAAVNTFSESTGVTASLINASDQSSGVVFSSNAYGSNAFVSVTKRGTSGDFFNTFKLEDAAELPDYSSAAASTSGNGFFADVDAGTVTVTSADQSGDKGRDVFAIVNGVLATGEGLKVSLDNASSLSLELTLDETFATTVDGSSSSFDITGGGALYQLGGQINTSQQINVALQSVAATRLGATLNDGELQFLSSLKSGAANSLASGNFAKASNVLESAIDEISTLRGRLGALERNTLQTNVRSLQTAIENLTASESQIRDADFAKETSALTRAQILNQTSTQVLGLANQQAQSVLSLLG